MIIISGCNSSFYLCIRQFLNNIKHYIRPCDKVYVVDLGLTNKQYNFLKSRNYQDKFNFELVQIPHDVVEKYPPHVKDKEKLKEHAKQHAGGMRSAHMRNMKTFMREGDSFRVAHNKAVKIDNNKKKM